MERLPEEQLALDHIWVHARQIADLAKEDGLKVIVRGEGCKLYDLRGREYIDGYAGLSVVNVGHGRSEIAEAMGTQARQLAYVSSIDHVTLPTVLLAQKLIRLTPDSLDRVFFCSGGSEAVETSIKIARQYQVLRGEPHRKTIIGRQESYHGATYGAMSVGGRGRPFVNKYFDPILPGVLHAPPVYCYRCPYKLTYPSCGIACVQAIEEIIRYQGPEIVAAVIAEPISASCGVAVPPPEYWPRLRDICALNGVLLIADEVITAFGRVGRWFGLEHWDVIPDMIIIGKGFSSGYAPIAACIVKSEIAEAFMGDKTKTFRHAFSFGGHPVSAAAALKNIEILEQDDLLVNSERMGIRLLEGLKTLSHHPSVGDVRGLGLLCAVELVWDKETKEQITMEQALILDRHLMKMGLLTRCWDILFLAPPLCITAEEVDRIVEIVDAALTRFEADLGIG